MEPPPNLPSRYATVIVRFVVTKRTTRELVVFGKSENSSVVKSKT